MRLTRRYLAVMFGGAIVVVAVMCIVAAVTGDPLWAFAVLLPVSARFVARATDHVPTESSPALARRDKRALALLAGVLLAMALFNLIAGASS